MSMMRPVSSASGMNWFGSTTPRVGWCQRSSASAATTAPDALSTIGCHATASCSRARAWVRSACRSKRSASSASSPASWWRCRQPAADGAQELVAGVGAEGVVDQAEAVEVDDGDRDDGAAAALPLEGLVEAVLEEDAVRQAGQRVVQGLVAQPGERLVAPDGGG